MISLHGVYENGKIKLSYEIEEPLPQNSEVVLTFLTDTDGSKVIVAARDDAFEERSEEYYESIREFERVKAYGNINIIDGSTKFTFPLNDYSKGGLGFFSDKPFEVGKLISAGIADPSNPDLILMELEMEVRGVYRVLEMADTNDGDRYKVGCMFIDPVDEDLWHGLLQYLS